MLPVIEMGEKIKSLRKKRGITQEQFAGYLNVSFQAVSKWERNESYPDITMIPRIAAFFDTSTDELLCTGRFKVEAEIEDYFSRKSEFDRLGETEKALGLMREANEKYPGNFKLMKGLIQAISWNDNKRNEEERRTDNLEIIEIAEKIRNECTEDSIRNDALYDLCMSYNKIGEKQKALDLIETHFSSFYKSQEQMREWVLEGDELKAQLERNISVFFQSVLYSMLHISRLSSPDEKIEWCERALKLNKSMTPYDDKSQVIYTFHRVIANTYLRENNTQKALEYLKKEAEMTVENDKSRKPSDEVTTVKNSVGNYSLWMLNELRGKFYDPIREIEEFRQIIKDLEQYARDDV